MTPHRLLWTPPLWASNLSWRLRGVTVGNYRRCCVRCGRTGQAHWLLLGCWRFKDPA